MPKPIVALVGRPNVGKSTLFNRLVGERLAIVDEAPGTTRDRLQADSIWNGGTFTVIATGERVAPRQAPGVSFALGLGGVCPLSAIHSVGTGEVLDALVESFPPLEVED